MNSAREQLAVTDRSLFFLGLIVLSVAFSWRSAWLQRQALSASLSGQEEDRACTAQVFSLSLSAGAIVLGSLGFFLVLTLQRAADAGREGGWSERRSAGLNASAAIFVFLAALLRLDDLIFRHARVGQATAPEPLPD